MIKKWSVFCVTCMRTILQTYEGRFTEKPAQDHLKDHFKKGVEARVIIGHFVDREKD